MKISQVYSYNVDVLLARPAIWLVTSAQEGSSLSIPWIYSGYKSKAEYNDACGRSTSNVYTPRWAVHREPGI